MLARIPLLVAAAAVVATGCAAQPSHVQAAAGPRAAAPSSLPDVPLRTLAGESTRIAAALGGHPALIDLWATWCDACREELPAVGRLAERAQARGAQVIAIAVGEKRETVAAYVAAHGLGWTQLVDEEFRFADALGQKRVPTTLVIDAQGGVAYVGGALDEEALAAFRRVLTSVQ